MTGLYRVEAAAESGADGAIFAESFISSLSLRGSVRLIFCCDDYIKMTDIKIL